MTCVPVAGPTTEPSIVTLDTVLCPTTWCVVREQREEFLVYNPRTDELHLISPFGHYLYRLCDGLRSVAEIQALLDPARGSAVPDFLAMLAARGLVEPVAAPGDAGRTAGGRAAP
jgi:hypothetical protein